MKRLFSLGLLSVAGAASAATVPIFINESPLVLPDAGLPTINAQAFVNQSTISVSPFTFTFSLGAGTFGLTTAGSLPFETFNTLFYTNEASGVMSGFPGFRFMNTSGRTRRPALWFVNEGAITTGGYLEVKAENILSTGPLDSSAGGLVRLVGKDVDVTRSRLRTGQGFATFFFGGYNDSPFRREYLNAAGVTDVYWGVGSNGMFLDTGPATRLSGPANFNLPFPNTPLHENQYLFGRRFATNRVSLPKFSFFGTNFFGTNIFSINNFAAFAYTNTVGRTAAMVQVVFVRTNSPDGNFSANVTFDPFAFDAEIEGPAQVLVELKRWDFDPSLDFNITNCFYLVDSMAIRTNLNLYRNSLYRTAVRGSNSRRPNVYEFFLSPPFNWPAQPPNSIFTNGLLDMGYLSNRVDMRYAGYSANVFTNVFSGLGGTFSPFTFVSSLIRPTNLPGRVEVFGDKLTLDSTRIRSESTVFVKTSDLRGNKLARLVDAPMVGYDIASTQPELVISNIAPTSVQRLSGTVCAWSGQWKNYQIDPVTSFTNEIHFHVLFVDHAFQPTVPASVFHFAARATNLVIADTVSLYQSSIGTFLIGDPVRNRKLRIDAESLDVRGSLSFPFGASWANSNVLRVVNFTNSGFVFVPGSAKYGTDRTAPYNNIVNSGTNTASSQLIRTRLFDNSGSFFSSQGPVQIDAVTARMEGPPIAIATNVFPLTTITNFFVVTNGFATNVFFSSVGAYIQSSSDLQIKAGDLSVSNCVLAAGGADPSGSFFFPGRLIMSVTNSLADAGPSDVMTVIPGYLSVSNAGPDALNLWRSAGFEMRRRPATSSLLGTWLGTTVPINALTTHIWPAQDRGAVAAGFTNNLALGKLTVNTSTNNGRAYFRSASGRQAMYVDYIELFNDATNFNRTMAVDPNMTIYFANANVPVSKLNGAVGGRFVWVPTFAGPLSTTNLIYPSGARYAFNIALISSLDIDSNNNGIPNALDPYPIDIPGEIIPPLSARSLLAGETTVIAPRLSLSLSDKTTPPRVMLSWTAPGFSENTVEFKDSFGEPEWSVLTNFVNGATSAPVQIYDPSTSGAARFYRLLIHPSPDR